MIGIQFSTHTKIDRPNQTFFCIYINYLHRLTRIQTIKSLIPFQKFVQKQPPLFHCKSTIFNY